MSDYPATKIVHCVNGPVPACKSHANKLVGLMAFLGAHVGVTQACPDDQCINCINEAKKDG